MSETLFYRHVGSFRPAPGTLHEVIDSADHSKPHNLLVAADACIDMAMLDETRPHTWLDRAQGLCDETIELTDWQSRHIDYPSTALNTAAATAILRKAELPNWGAVATGDPPKNNYILALGTAEEVARRDYQDFYTDSIIKEFIPLLLGARSLDRGQLGWFGRLALSRENQRQSAITGNIHWSWDTLLTTPDASPEAFDVLETVLQVKNSPKNGNPSVTKYARAGIVSLSALRAGFSLPKRVVWGCVEEALGDQLPRFLYENNTTSPYSPYSLDSITEQTQQLIKEGKDLVYFTTRDRLAEIDDEQLS